VNFTSNFHDSDAIIKAFNDTIYELFVKNSLRFDIFIVNFTSFHTYKETYEFFKLNLTAVEMESKSSKQDHLNEYLISIKNRTRSKTHQIIDGILKLNQNCYTCRVFNYTENEIFSLLNSKIEVNSSAIFIFDEPEQYISSLIHFNNEFYKEIKILIFCERLNEEFVKNNIGSFPLDSISIEGEMQINFYFLVPNDKSIKLLTYEWCKDFGNYGVTKIINVFNVKNLHWTEEPFLVEEKFTNLSGCVIKKEISEFYPTDASNLIFSSIAHVTHASFSTEEDECDIPRYTELTLSCAFKFGFLEKNVFFQKKHFTYPYERDELVVIIPPGKLYTNYEKLYLPFDFTTWWFLIATFSGAFLLILIVNLMPQIIKDMFYGENVNMPAWNVVSAFFGIGQTRLPSGNFARFILMMFILFCLIFRTAYQGIQFEMMTTDMQREPMKTFQELTDENFTVFFRKDFESFIYKNDIEEMFEMLDVQ
jgi:hypothetical protein